MKSVLRGIAKFWLKEGRLREFSIDRGVENPEHLANVICARPLIASWSLQFLQTYVIFIRYMRVRILYINALRVKTIYVRKYETRTLRPSTAHDS